MKYLFRLRRRILATRRASRTQSMLRNNRGSIDRFWKVLRSHKILNHSFAKSDHAFHIGQTRTLLAGIFKACNLLGLTVPVSSTSSRLLLQV
jgi:hypothetical protein